MSTQILLPERSRWGIFAASPEFKLGASFERITPAKFESLVATVARDIGGARDFVSKSVARNTTMNAHVNDLARVYGRRELLHQFATATTWGFAALLTADALATRVHAATQDNWRMCRKCNMMFYAGYRRSICPAGQRHDAAVGANFLLPYDVPETANAQGAWRFCNKCESLFFDGYPGKGVCPRGGGHLAQGFVFVLPHDIPARGYVEKDWRFCTKCYAIFSAPGGRTGRCPAGAGHTAQGFNFALRFRGNLEGDTVGIPVDN